MLTNYIKDELNHLEYKGLLRIFKGMEGPQGPRITIGGRDVVNLTSNNFLGLANHPRLKEALTESADLWGVGSGGSRLVCGTMKPHLDLEERIASFKGTESSLLFSTGYHANIGIITSMAGRGDIILSDRSNHASIVDACLLSRAKIRRYPHLNTEALETMLRDSAGYRRRIIVTEGVFSMDGDVAPLMEISRLAKRYDSILIVDDAHGTGVLGRRGSGTVEHLEVDAADIIQMGTLGKAVGTFGAFAAGKREVMDYLANKARTFIYTTALPPSICSSSIAALDIIEKEPEMREELNKRSTYIRKALEDSGFHTLSGTSHIIPVIIGEPKKTIEVGNRLLKEGVYIQPIRPPTVPEGTGRLRITPMATHKWSDLEYAVERIIETSRSAT